ncbi:RNA 3'-terminal phosphate cyclase-like protein [Echinococcus granulosus]|nr:RNA 3'-terminal phosphate cyclase-like protein [Echinococcus granulosus]
MPPIVYEDGPVGFRQKILLSVISNRPIRIKNIRSKSKNPGVTSAEVDYLKLINELSNGAIVKVNDTGCNVFFSPGTLIGGEVEFTCSAERGLGYYLEPVVLLCSFTKVPLILTLNGVTNNRIDPSVDVIMQSWLPFLKKFLPPASASGLKMEIKKRGVPPKGGGKIIFTSKPANFLSPIQLFTPGKVYRIRGVSWTCRVSPGIASQLMHGAKQLLNSFLSDVYINLDQRRREVAGGSSGFGMVLWAETKEGVFYTAEVCSAAESDAAAPAPIVPSELGFEAASRLLDQIYLGGCVDESLQSTALSLMAFEGGRNASQLLISDPTPHTVQTLRLLRKVIGVTFDLTYADRMKLNEEEEEEEEEEEKEKEKKKEIGLEEENTSRMDDSEEAKEEASLERPVPLVATCFGSGLRNINLSIR